MKPQFKDELKLEQLIFSLSLSLTIHLFLTLSFYLSPHTHTIYLVEYKESYHST